MAPVSGCKHRIPLACQTCLRYTGNSSPITVKIVYAANSQKEWHGTKQIIGGGLAMNQSLHFIFTRRSVRKYQDRAIPAEMFDDLFAAAMSAPSAVARDP